MAAAALGTQSGGHIQHSDEARSLVPDVSNKLSFMNQIVDLNVGEALLFAPGAILERASDETYSQGLCRLGAGYMVVKIRKRLTEDGGKSVLCA